LTGIIEDEPIGLFGINLRKHIRWVIGAVIN
jgi:hypothetical protein